MCGLEIIQDEINRDRQSIPTLLYKLTGTGLSDQTQTMGENPIFTLHAVPRVFILPPFFPTLEFTFSEI